MATDDNMVGAGLMTLSMTAFTVNDALMKLTAGVVPFFQGIAIRGAIITAFLVCLAWRRGYLRIRPDRRDRRLILIRTAAEVASTLLFLTALYRMPLANLSAILQALTLTVTIGAAVFFGEPVGWRRLVAILVGLCGVLLIIQPGGDGFTAWSLLGVGAVVMVTARDLAARRLSRTVPSVVVAVSAALAVTALAVVGMLAAGPAAIPLWALACLSGAALCLSVGYVSAVAAMRVGEVGAVTPFRYSALLVALILGLVVFGEWPDAVTLIGAAIVVSTGLFTIWRERARPIPPALRVR